jgi:hypothetical protein
MGMDPMRHIRKKVVGLFNFPLRLFLRNTCDPFGPPPSLLILSVGHVSQVIYLMSRFLNSREASVCIHCKKRLTIFHPHAGMSLTKLFLARIIELQYSRPGRVCLVTSRQRTEELLTFFYSVLSYVNIDC